jgi:hypothetical protein
MINPYLLTLLRTSLISIGEQLRKYADNEQLPKETRKPRTGMMYEEQWGEILTDWLWEDQKFKKKLRRTNTKMFRDLKEMGFPGSYRTLCNYVKEWRESKQVEEDTQDMNSERLDHPPGEAQLDFGLMEVVKDGNYMDVHCLVYGMIKM